jgi:hypothetical protein
MNNTFMDYIPKNKKLILLPQKCAKGAKEATTPKWGSASEDGLCENCHPERFYRGSGFEWTRNGFPIRDAAGMTRERAINNDSSLHPCDFCPFLRQKRCYAVRFIFPLAVFGRWSTNSKSSGTLY